MRPALRALPLLYCGLALASSAAGQGLTGAAIEGRVRDSSGRAPADPVVELTHLPSGVSTRPLVTPDGRYLIEHVSSGGPYRLIVRAIGYRPMVVDSVWVASGQRLRIDLTLQGAAASLDELRVTVAANPRLGPGRGGPEQQFEREDIARLPNIQRNLINLGVPGPHVLRFGFNGWNDQLTAYTVDGGQGADLYRGGHTGAGVFGAPLPVEAIEEVRLLPAPYDVRYGQASSGQFALTTLRPTSRWTGSVYGTYQSDAVVNQAPNAAPFTAWNTGVSATGPVNRRLQVALVAEYGRAVFADQGPFVTDTTGNDEPGATGVSWESAERFRRILAEQWGLDAGSLGASNTERPRLDFWIKLAGRLGAGSALELSQRLATGHDEGAITRRRTQPYRTGSTTRIDRRDIAETRLVWRTNPEGRWANELIAGLRFLRERCTPAGGFPRVVADADAGALAAGADSTCGTTDIRQVALELSEHATFPVGRHLLTAGIHAEWFTVEDPVLLGSQGVWHFPSLEALEAGAADRYERTVSALPDGRVPSSDFAVWSLGWYFQDRLRLGDRVEVAAGLRLDRPALPESGILNPAVFESLGLATGSPPEPHWLWSPRASVTWDVTGRGSTWLRAGGGIFTGRPPYRWLGGIYRGSGAEQAVLSCRGSTTPSFNPHDQPEECGSGARPIGQKNVYDPALRFPQILQLSAGIDQALRWGFIATGDIVAGWGQSQFRFTDANLSGPVGAAAGEAARPLYGDIATSGAATPARPDPALGTVVLIDRGRGDRTLSLSTGLQRPFRQGWAVQASYRWNTAQDRQSVESTDPLVNLAATPLEGTIEDRRLGRSVYHSRHRVFGQVSLGLPWQGLFSLIYVGNNGQPYSYVIDGDANADGFGQTVSTANDLVYVPRDPREGGDIRLVTSTGAPAPASSYATLDSLIGAEPCLRSRRGTLAARNGCTNPWVHFTNARLEVAVPTVSGQRVSLAVDVYNLPNLLNRRWGQVSQVASGPVFPLLSLAGWDAAAGRGLYRLRQPLPARATAEQLSRWRLQFTARYRF